MGDLAIKIGAGSQVFSNLKDAYDMRGNQKLSISGSGDDIKAALSGANGITALAAAIGNIKSSSDIILSADDVTANKAALLKLGTRSLVLQGASGTESNQEVSQNFAALDSVYTKFKSMNISGDTTFDVSKLATAVNLGSMGVLSGKSFSISGTGADLKTNMASILKNISKISQVIVSGGTELVLNADQLKVIGDKLVKADTTALAFAGIDTATATDASKKVTTIANHNFKTGDKVAIAGTITAEKYVRKLSDNTFALYDSIEHATDVGNSGTAGIFDATTLTDETITASASSIKLKDTGANLLSAGGLALINKYNNTNIVLGGSGNEPIRTTKVDSIDVTNASVSMANRLSVLTTSDGISTAGHKFSGLANIFKNIEISDTVDNLNAVGNGGLTLADGVGGVAVVIAAGATNGNITGITHGFKTGDAVYYEKGTTAIGGLADKTTYYAIRNSDTSFALAATRADAIAGTKVPLSTSAGTGTQKFTTSALDNAISKVSRFNTNTGSVTRVTIAGSGPITTIKLDEIAAKVKRGSESSADITYSAKAVDIQNNMQALYDNKVSSDNKLTEIVVTDGTSTGKKALTLTEQFYGQLKNLFTRGVDQNSGIIKNKNYAYNVTKAAWDTTNPTALQGDANVASYAIVDASYNQLKAFAGATSTVAGDDLRIALGQSKLKTVTSQSGITADQRTYINTLIASIGSPTDRAKLKLLS